MAFPRPKPSGKRGPQAPWMGLEARFSNQFPDTTAEGALMAISLCFITLDRSTISPCPYPGLLQDVGSSEGQSGQAGV